MMTIVTLYCISICLVMMRVEALPLPGSGPTLDHDWTETVRLKHLYAARKGLHLQIRKDGRVDGSPQQTELSKHS